MTGLREQKKRATRTAILAAAIELFGERGFEETSMEQLARAAGVGKSTIYGYFPNKTAVLLAFCDDELDYVFSTFEKECDPEAPLIDQLLILFMLQFRFVTENREFGRIFVREMSFPKRDQLEPSKEQDDRYLSAVAAILNRAGERGELRDGFDPFMATAHCYAHYLMLLSAWYRGYIENEEELQEALRQLFTQTLEGLAGPNYQTISQSGQEAE